VLLQFTKRAGFIVSYGLDTRLVTTWAQQLNYLSVIWVNTIWVQENNVLGALVSQQQYTKISILCLTKNIVWQKTGPRISLVVEVVVTLCNLDLCNRVDELSSGCLELVDWTSGLENWAGTLGWNNGMT